MLSTINVLQVEEFSKEVETDNLHFSPNGVVIIWKWRVMTSASDGESDSTEKESSETQSMRGGYNSDVEEDRTSELTFKCIGTTKTTDYQQVLQRARDIRSRGSPVSVKLVHEPQNPCDSRAIAFKCEVDGKWQTIGYVVSELLEEVHAAINAGSILSVQFAWIRYITDWSRSGPGFFAGIAIERIGEWSSTAKRAASTR